MSDPGQRLVVYGSLAPGEVNHHALGEAGRGHWQPCIVKAQMGMIGPWKILSLDDGAGWIEAQLLTSPHLPAIWQALDEFEGQAYKRVICTADTASGPVEAYVYVATGLPLEDETAGLP